MASRNTGAALAAAVLAWVAVLLLTSAPAPAAPAPFAETVALSELSGAQPDAVAPAVKSASTTKVSESATSVDYGNESSVQFTVEVAGAGTGETAEVKVGTGGSAAVCTATLSSGVGKCSIANAALSAAGGHYAVSAHYAGDANLEPSEGTAAVGLEVTGGRVTVKVSVSPSAEVTYGDESAVEFRAEVTAENDTPLPSGESAKIHIGSETCTVTLSGGETSKGTCKISDTALPAGSSYPLSAEYEGDQNLSGPVTSQNSVSLLVKRESTSFKIKLNGSETASLSIVHGATATLAESGLSAEAVGTVKFTSGATELCKVTLPASSCTTSAALPVGSYPAVSAEFTETGGNYASSQIMSGLSLTVEQSPTSFKIKLNGSESASLSIVHGATATLAESGLPAEAVGTVKFTSGATELCKLTLPASSCTTSAALAAGSYAAISAEFTQTGGSYASSSAVSGLSLTVEQAPTTFKIKINGSETSVSIAHGSTASLSQSGLPAEAVGTVKFTSGGTELCRLTLPASSCTTSATLGSGSYPAIGAEFTETGGNYASSSALSGLSLTVTAPTQFRVRVSGSESPAPIVYGSAVKLEQSGLPAEAHGMVTFSAGSSELCSFSAPEGSSCSHALPAGNYTITASFVMTSGSYPSASSLNSVPLTVERAPTAFTITVGGTSAASGPYGSSATLGESGLPAAATGTVTYSSGGTTLCTASLPSGSCATSTGLVPGSYAGITGTFTDTDGNYSSGSSSDTGSWTVERVPSAVTISSAPSPSTPYTHLTLTATVLPGRSVGRVPTGTVTFMSGVHTLGTGTLNALGVAKLETDAPAPGAYYASASYAGDVAFTGSQSPVIIQSVKETFAGLFELTAGYLHGSSGYRKLSKKKRIGQDAQLAEIDKLLSVAREKASESVLAATIYDADMIVSKGEDLLSAAQAESLIALADALPAPKLVAVTAIGGVLKGHAVAVGTIRSGADELSLSRLKGGHGNRYTLAIRVHSHGHSQTLLTHGVTIS